MEVVVGLFQSQVCLLLAVLIGSLLIGRLLKIPPFFALLAAVVPVALPHFALPSLSRMHAEHPEGVFAGAWLAVFVAGLLWRVCSPLVGGVVQSVGILRAGYLFGLGAALVVVSLLFFAPEILIERAPHWRSSFGGLLLAASLLGVSKAFARVLKAGALLVVWSGVSVILASQVFLQKMPYAIEWRDLAKLEGALPAEAVESCVRTLRKLAIVGNQVAGGIGVSGFELLGTAEGVSADLRELRVANTTRQDRDRVT